MSFCFHTVYIGSYISTGWQLETFPGGLDGKESACNVGDLGLIPRLGRSPGEGKCYSSILAWRIPWTEEPGGSMASQSDRTKQLTLSNFQPLHSRRWRNCSFKKFSIQRVLGAALKGTRKEPSAECGEVWVSHLGLWGCTQASQGTSRIRRWTSCWRPQAYSKRCVPSRPFDILIWLLLTFLLSLQSQTSVPLQKSGRC